MNEVEQLVIKNLLLDEEYVRKAMPFIKTEYFADTTGKKLFDIVSKYFTEYSAIPTKEALVIEVGQVGGISDDQHQEIVKAIGNIDTDKSEFEWILDTTEKWCKERALYLALMSSIKIAEGNDEQRLTHTSPCKSNVESLVRKTTLCNLVEEFQVERNLFFFLMIEVVSFFVIFKVIVTYMIVKCNC